MTPAGLAGALLLLLPVLAACGGHRETKTERQIKTYIEATQPYYEILKEQPADAKVDELSCGTVPGRSDALACDITLRGVKKQRWAVYKEPRGKFDFGLCEGYVRHGERSYRPESDPCVVDISN